VLSKASNGGEEKNNDAESNALRASVAQVEDFVQKSRQQLLKMEGNANMQGNQIIEPPKLSEEEKIAKLRRKKRGKQKQRYLQQKAEDLKMGGRS